MMQKRDKPTWTVRLNIDGFSIMTVRTSEESAERIAKAFGLPWGSNAISRWPLTMHKIGHEVELEQQVLSTALAPKMKFPFVAFGRMLDHNDYAYVDEDGEYGMGLITCHLTDLGHKRIAYLDAPGHFMFAHYRRQGFLDGLKENGLEIDQDLMVTGDMTQRAGYQLATDLLTQESPPTAIVACNDLMALGAISAAQQLGLTVGKEVAITGFDNIPLAEHCHPPLTTVHQPIYQIGEMVCEMLIKQIRAEPLEQEQIILQPSLVVRQSSLGTLNTL